MTQAQRRTYTLTQAELSARRALRPHYGEAWPFWRAVCAARGLDLATVLSTPAIDKFTALPLGHGKVWCHPMPLKCGPVPTHALKDQP